ncbi:MAG: Phytoene synthase [uncultured Acetobacteraceae bacterium]|uniref:Phytoene synthase n=1 Tax=uncultured Acetobacteraceae bacterium TaxID=169975 RepID=A0A6J4JLY2_9PROT|nr:MAG: Phytoene synthase [uncultured Acetobacteraceae bacterium]
MPPGRDAAPWVAGHEADLAACRALLRGGSRSFHAASLLLPRRVRAPASALYAFCRLADDAVDLGGGRTAAVARLRERLARAYEGRPLPIPADRAFAVVVARHGIPRALPEALLEGLAWDAEGGRRYEDLAALETYAARVAGSVGCMMAVLMGVRDRAALARACDLGVAMQLTNIARDVGEDARAGRLYLPLRWLREAGVASDEWLARPVFDPAVAGVVRRLLLAADELYRRAEAGIATLPAGCRPGIRAAGLLYAGIGREVESRGFDSVTGRARVPASRKAVLLLRAALPGPGRAPPAAPARAAPPLAATRFLVEAVADAAAPLGPAVAIPAGWGLEARAVWVIDLFARLERRDREAASATAARSG